nr:MAG TPA: hypothetical protein [Caudoviricetes sp.]
MFSLVKRYKIFLSFPLVNKAAVILFKMAFCLRTTY